MVQDGEASSVPRRDEHGQKESPAQTTTKQGFAK
jgi:hypothetical protein